MKGFRRIIFLFALFIFWSIPCLAEVAAQNFPDYREFPLIGSRVAIWIVAQLHLMFAAFVVGVPVFAVIVEYIGIRTKDTRYDKLAKEFTKLLVVAFSTTAIFGAILLFLLISLYPKFFNYMNTIFYPTMWLYAFLFFGEAFSLYLYWYSWDRMTERKRLHLTLGVILNIMGTLLMVIANAWATFMMSPGGVDEQGNLISLYGAIRNYTWNPINIHRFIANISFGGAIVAAYAAVRFLGAKTQEEKAHYDWMGYVGNFIAISALLALPFAGYYLGRELYAFNQQMGITLMGGFLSWLWVIQGVLIGVLFLGSNYYLWLGMERIQGAERYRKYIKYMLFVLTVGFLIWITPHSLVASLEEARRIGATHHPLLGVLGVMSAKNTVVNIMILTTYLSFLLYRRGNKEATVSWAKMGNVAQGLIFLIAASVVIFYGIYGYYVEAIVRIGFSTYQVLVVLSALILITIIDILLFRNAKKIGTIEWGNIPPRSQYVLFLLAVTFTWLMGLMGYARSIARQHWHIYGIMRDTSPHAYSPTLGYAGNVISVCVLLFLAFVLFIFWIGKLEEKVKVPKAVPVPAYNGGKKEEK